MTVLGAAEARAEYWFNEYCAMGPDRSIRVLLAQAQRTGSIEGLGPPPGLRTLFRWSTEFSWDRRAKDYDRRITMEARNRLAKERVEDAIKRQTERLQMSRAFRGLLQSGLIVEEPVMDPYGLPVVNPDGTPATKRRAVKFYELTDSQVRSLVMLHNASAETERLDLPVNIDPTKPQGDTLAEEEYTEVLGLEVLNELAHFLQKPPEQAG